MPAELTSEIDRAARVLRTADLVAFPTETVYGLGANALDASAVAGIFAAKQRPEFDPLIVHIARRDQLNELTHDLPESAALLADRFWPGPLTLVLPKREIVPDLVTAGLPTVGIRMPGHPVALELLRTANLPVAAPSANLFGRISPTTAAHVMDQLADRIDLVLDGGPCAVGVESTIVEPSDDHLVVLRPGGVTLEELRDIGLPVSLQTSSANPSQPLSAPGTLESHYAPRTPLTLVPDLPSLAPAPDAGVLAFTPLDDPGRFAEVLVLSETGCLKEAAAGFFAALRHLDAQGYEQIYASCFPSRGLGIALNDRLRRAASRHPA